MQEVVMKEIVKLLDTGIIYLIADSPWVSPLHYVPKKGATAKDHFPLPFMDQMLKRLIGNKYFYFLDGFTGYSQIHIDPNDQEKTTFTCPFSTYAYRRMPFGVCNALATFQRCMLAIFHGMIEESVEVFMEDFSIFRNSFDKCLNNLDKMLQCYKDAHLVLNLEKCYFVAKEGIVLGYKVSGAGLKVHKAKINVISKLPPPTNIKGIRSFLGHAGFYQRTIKDFSKIARPITKLLEKDTLFEFNDECQKAFKLLKEKLTCAPVIVSPNWYLPFELMCDASDFAVGAVLGKKDGKNFHPIYFASKTLNPTQQKYTVLEYEDWTGAVADINEDGFCVLSKHPIVTIPLLPDFGGVTYHRFIQDFSKISWPMTYLLEKDTPLFFSKECIESFNTLKKKLTEAPILVAPDWDLPLEIMCDASDYAVGVVLGQRKTKHFQPIHYASKTMIDAQAHYTTTEKELLAVVYAFKKFWPYLVLSKTIDYTDHSGIKYLLAKQDAKPRLLH
ncbi:reverse transcriptase domain-containing protein [Tanacetum coccineum]